MLDMILQEARRLGVEERRRLIDLLRAQVLAELGKAGGEPDACPRCGGTHLVRKGHDRDGSQRWACRSCGRTLSRKTMGLLGYSKLKEDVWASYVEHACAGGTLRECARACGVCLSTSWFMRMRLCEVMGRALAPFRSGPTVSCQVDGTYLNESLAGNRSRSRVGMPRGSHRCGGDVRERGISNLKVCVLCGANDLGDEFCELADRGRPTDEALGSALRAVGEGTPVSTDGLQGYARVLPRLGVSCHDATPAREARHGELGMVNAMHARLKDFLARLGGSRRGGSATTSTGSCGTSRRGGRTPTGRTPCRARRRPAATTTRASPSRGSRSRSGPTGRISWLCQRWSNREWGICVHCCDTRLRRVARTAPSRGRRLHRGVNPHKPRRI